MLGASLHMNKNERTPPPPPPGTDDPSIHIDSLILRLSIIHKDGKRVICYLLAVCRAHRGLPV